MVVVTCSGWPVWGFEHARLDVSGYSALAMQLQNFCLKLYPHDAYTRVTNTVYAEHFMTTTGGGGAGTADNNIDNSNNNINTLTKIGFSGNGTILAETDYRFFLLRHTSLWQAMLWSDYCSTLLAAFDGARPAQAARTAGANGLAADRVPPAFCVYETSAAT